MPTRRFGRLSLIAIAFGLAGLTGLAGCASERSQPVDPTGPSATQPGATDPGTETPDPAQLRHERAEHIVDGLSTRQRAGAVIMSSVPGTDPSGLHALMQQTGLGGFLLMGSNIPSTPEELKQLTASLTVDSACPPLVSIDEEGGIVKRLPWDGFPGADRLRTAPAADVTAAFAGRARLLAQVGINVNFGIVADVTNDPNHFIYERSLGDDPAGAAQRVAAAVAGEHGLVASTLKHFPGHGAPPGDSHYTIPQTDKPLDAWRNSDAVPFEAGIDAGAELLMFGHLSYTAMTPKPASLAPEWYSYARNTLGFTGVMVTDDLGMLPESGLPEYQDPVANTVAALSAGADLALVMNGMDASSLDALVDGVARAADSGALDGSRLRDAAVRVVDLRLQLADG